MQLCRPLFAEITLAGVIKHVVCWCSQPMLDSIMRAMERCNLLPFQFGFIVNCTVALTRIIVLLSVGWCDCTKRRWMPFEYGPWIHTFNHFGLPEYFTNQFESETKCDQRDFCGYCTAIRRLWEVIEARWRFIQCNFVRRFFERCGTGQRAI